ncbi:MAG: DUF348 domain-containing protein [Candidatus Moranbacteria bacterium]|nr:DUF348 domain-containing protein [Candidatus Moranbacteria bacterium]
MKKNKFFLRFSLTILANLAILSLSVVFYVFSYTHNSIAREDLTSPELIKDKKVTLFFNQKVIHLITQQDKVVDLISELNIEINQEDYVFPNIEDRVKNNMVLVINKRNKYLVLDANEEIEHKTYSIKVKDVLQEIGINLNSSDQVEPALEEILANGDEIVITRIETEEVVETEIIPFETVEKKDEDLDYGQVKVKQEGKNGKKEVKYSITYKNGEIENKEILETKIVLEPEEKIVVKGTKVRLGKAVKGTATWYAYTGTMACASRDYPKGTELKVTNLENGKSVVVVVNDYGPMEYTGHIIDLDKVAFAKIANLGQGVIRVKIEKLKK